MKKIEKQKNIKKEKTKKEKIKKRIKNFIKTENTIPSIDNILQDEELNDYNDYYVIYNTIIRGDE